MPLFDFFAWCLATAFALLIWFTGDIFTGMRACVEACESMPQPERKVIAKLLTCPKCCTYWFALVLGCIGFGLGGLIDTIKIAFIYIPAAALIAWCGFSVIRFVSDFFTGPDDELDGDESVPVS